jgi:hypothetical protein
VANFARPSADISRGSWTTQSGGTASLFSTLDEEVADDNDYVISALNANSTYEVRLSSVAPAVIPRAHLIALRGRKDASGGNTKGVTVDLVQGSTVIGTMPFPDLPFTIQQQNIDIPRSMALQITNYADLRVRLTSTGITSGGSARRRAIVTGIALRVPSAIDLVDDLRVRWSLIGATPKEIREELESDIAASPDNMILRWRYEVAYGLYKVIEYEKLRAAILDGSYTLPPHQNVPEEIINIDAKIARFIASARAHDDETLVPEVTTTTTEPPTTSTTWPPP